MFDVTTIIKAVFALIGIILTCIVIPYIRSKTTVEQQAAINGWVATAVEAAEQLYIGSGRGAEKKQYVLNWLTSHNIKFDSNKVDAMIEAAVYELKNGII